MENVINARARMVFKILSGPGFGDDQNLAAFHLSNPRVNENRGKLSEISETNGNY